MTYIKIGSENNKDKLLCLIKNNTNESVIGDFYEFKRRCYNNVPDSHLSPIADNVISLPANSSIEHTIYIDSIKNSKLAFRPYKKYKKGKWIDWSKCRKSDDPNNPICVMEEGKSEWQEFTDWEKEQFGIWVKEGWEECK